MYDKAVPTDFQNKVYLALKKVPVGQVTTYKKLAEQIGTKAYRAVGVALAQNPYAPQVPCHRVVASDGSIGGFMGKKVGQTIAKKIKMLSTEGVRVKDGKIIDFKTKLFK